MPILSLTQYAEIRKLYTAMGRWEVLSMLEPELAAAISVVLFLRWGYAET